jgi:DNA-directed RNA polymerase subunit RPC12/RpoP
MTAPEACPRCGAAIRPNAWDYKSRLFADCGSRIFVEGRSREPSEHTPACRIAELTARAERAEAALSYTLPFREFSDEWHNADNRDVVEFRRLRAAALLPPADKETSDA